ncbi:MAG: hypothetical protein ACFFKA_16990 [Candidatus Thorarchaeota archaeon]
MVPTSNFNFKPYLKQLLEKNDHIQSLADIEKVYSSYEYSQFITDLFAFFKNKDEIYPSKQNTIRTIINNFWTSFLGESLLDRYIFRTKKP